MVARLSTTMAAAAAFSLSSRRLLASCSFLGFAQENTRMSFRAFHNGEAAATPLSGSNGFPFLFPSLRHLSSSTASSSSSYKQKGEGGRRGGGGGAKHFSWEKLRKEEYNAISNRMSTSDRTKLKKALNRFRYSALAETKARRLVPADIYPQTMRKFCSKIIGHLTEDLKGFIVSHQEGKRENVRRIESLLFRLYGEYVNSDYAEICDNYKRRYSASDMRQCHKWYDHARSMKRKLIYHAGPTNSGKTYQAIQRLLEAESGVYCAPLRLLAAEGYDTMIREGAVPDLITGQEMKTSPFSTHYACTIEMADLNKEVDVAVLDEIQMISDPHRGYAWTRALLGVPAKEIHLCGDETVLKLVERLAKKMNEKLEVRRYSRYKPLELEAKPLEDLGRVQEGDCLIAFSKKEIYRLKLEIESRTRYKCAIIYGNLPPETRRQQADLFNDPETEYKVLVATDAVGMGLNLSVRRIIFTKLVKYCGVSNSLAVLSASQAKQIAGRAGRRSSDFEKGLVSALNVEDMTTLKRLLKERLKPNRLAGILPPFEQIELFASLQPEEVVNNFRWLLREFQSQAQLEDGLYFMCRTKELETMGKLLTPFRGMTLEEKYKFVIAPIDTSNKDVVISFLKYVRLFNASKSVSVNLQLPSPRSESYVHKLENSFKILSLYLWLSLRFPEEFTEHEKAQMMLEQCTHRIQVALEKLSPEALKKKKVSLASYISSPRRRMSKKR